MKLDMFCWVLEIMSDCQVSLQTRYATDYTIINNVDINSCYIQIYSSVSYKRTFPSKHHQLQP